MATKQRQGAGWEFLSPAVFADARVKGLKGRITGDGYEVTVDGVEWSVVVDRRKGIWHAIPACPGQRSREGRNVDRLVQSLLNGGR